VLPDFSYLYQARLPNPSLATHQHHVVHALFHLYPALQEHANPLLPTNECCETSGGRDVQAALYAALPQNTIDPEWRYDASQRLSSVIMKEKIPLAQLIRRRTDHHRIGRSVSLEPGGNIGRVPQRQVFLSTSPADLTHNHHTRMKTMPNPVPTARGASSSCAWE
jgi:hypothetical protein